MSEQTATIPRTQQRRAAAPSMHADHHVNVGALERVLSLIAGGALALYGLRHSLGYLMLMLGGGALIYRGLTGYCAAYQTAAASRRSPSRRRWPKA